MMAGLLDEYTQLGPPPDLGAMIDPAELERQKYLAMMRMGLGVAGREPIGSAMQGGINTMLAGQEEARRMAQSKAQAALQQYKAQQAYQDDLRRVSFIKKLDDNTLLAAGMPQVLIDSIKASDKPQEAVLTLRSFFEQKKYGPGEVSHNPLTGVTFQTPSKEGTTVNYGPNGEMSMGTVPGALATQEELARVAARGKGMGEAETTLQEAPVAGGRPGQVELVPRSRLLSEYGNAAPAPLPPAASGPRKGNATQIGALQQAFAEEAGLLKTTTDPEQRRRIEKNLVAISQELTNFGAGPVGGAEPVSGRRIKDPVAQKEAEARIPSTPEGYRWTDKGLEQVPGGPKDTSEQEKLKITNAVNRADLVMKKVDEVKKAVDWTTVGPASSLVGWVPGTPQYDLKKNVDMLKANIGFQELAAMRAASPTGGALGQVALQELDMLQSTLGSLDTSQSPTEIKKNLDNVMTHFNNWKRTMEQSGAKFNRGGSGDWGAPAPAAPSTVLRFDSKGNPI